MSLKTFKGLCAVIAIVSLGGPASLASALAARATPPHCVDGAMLPAAGDEASVDAVTLCLVNAIRSAHRLARLHANPALALVASGQVHRMVALDYFADVGPGGQTPQSLIAESRYPGASGAFTYGQNLAWGTGPMMTPTSIVAAWMASPPHRRIILDRAFRDAGVGVTAQVPAIVGAGVGATYAMEFAVRR
jgi:uncharacterized protein YkwD